MKIWWLSATPYTRSGYGVQTHVACRGLGLAGHDVRVIAMNRPQEAMSVVWEFPDRRIAQTEGMVDFSEFGAKKLYRIYPHGIGTQQEVQSGDTSWMMGAKMLQLMLQVDRPDCVISLQDTQNVSFLGQISGGMNIPWFHWLPWDNIQWEPDMSKFCMETQCQIVAMSDFAEKLMQDAKFPYIGKIYHGVDTKAYRPLGVPKAETRKQLGFEEPDKFWIGYVGANEERKHPDILIDSFAKFAKTHKDARLYLHTDVQESYPAHYSYNMIPMLQKEDCDEETRHTSRAHYVAKFSDKAMNMLYNSMDMLASTTAGEGFGLMALYGNASGIPTNDNLCRSGRLQTTVD